MVARRRRIESSCATSIKCLADNRHREGAPTASVPSPRNDVQRDSRNDRNGAVSGGKCRSSWMQQRPLRGARRLRICRRSNDATMHSPRSPSRVNAFVSTSATALLISEKTSYPAQADSSPERYPNRTIWAAPHLRAARPLWSESGRRGGVSDLGGGEQPTPEASAASTSGSALSQDAECRLCARRLRDARWNKSDEGHPRPQARVCVWRPSLRPGDVPRSG